jgi:TonB family protein
MRLFLVLLLVCALAPPVGAQNIVGGFAVEPEKRRPLACIEVVMVDSGGRVVAHTRTAHDGSFQFDSPDSGRYRYRFEMLDHESLYSPFVSLDKSSTTAEQFQLDFGDPLKTTRTPPSDTAADAGPWPKPTNRGPRYPPDLRGSEVDGDVLMRFVIDSAGTVDQATIRVLRSNDREFTESVQAFLRRARFEPAHRNHRPVCSLVDMPFEFRISR